MLQNVNIPKNDFLIELKQAALGNQAAFKIKSHDGFMSPTVQQSLSILRVILYNEHQNLELLSDLAGAFERDKYIPPMTKKQEIRVLLEMSRLLRKKLSEYPRTISGDIALVRTGKMSQVELDILHITIMEKV